MSDIHYGEIQSAGMGFTLPMITTGPMNGLKKRRLHNGKADTRIDRHYQS